MAHKIFTKANGAWKQARKGWMYDSSGNLVKIKKGWVKVDSAGGWKLFFAGGFPKGIILPYNSTASVPSGWVAYTAPNGRSIIGADSTYPVKTSGGTYSVSHTGRIATSGTHDGPVHNWNASFNGDGDCSYCIKYDGDAHHGYATGGHSHSNITGTVKVTPRRSGLRLIKLTSDSSSLVPHIGVFSAVDISGNEEVQGTNFTEISTNSTYRSTVNINGISTVQDHYVGSDNTANKRLGDFKNLSTAQTTSYEGGHHHGGVRRTLWTSNSGYYAVYAGGHRHTVQARSYTHNYSYYYLSMWESASHVIESSPNMIGMWEGVYPPEGWTLCDGTRGTPDLRNRFIRFANGASNRGHAGGEMKAQLGTLTSSNGHHNHIPSNQNSNAASTHLEIRHSGSVSHYHEGTDVKRKLTPQYYALSFIMKLSV